MSSWFHQPGLVQRTTSHSTPAYLSALLFFLPFLLQYFLCFGGGKVNREVPWGWIPQSLILDHWLVHQVKFLKSGYWLANLDEVVRSKGVWRAEGVLSECVLLDKGEAVSRTPALQTHVWDGKAINETGKVFLWSECECWECVQTTGNYSFLLLAGCNLRLHLYGRGAQPS